MGARPDENWRIWQTAYRPLSILLCGQVRHLSGSETYRPNRQSRHLWNLSIDSKLRIGLVLEICIAMRTNQLWASNGPWNWKRYHEAWTSEYKEQGEDGLSCSGVILWWANLPRIELPHADMHQLWWKVCLIISGCFRTWVIWIQIWY